MPLSSETKAQAQLGVGMTAFFRDTLSWERLVVAAGGLQTFRPKAVLGCFSTPLIL